MSIVDLHEVTKSYQNGPSVLTVLDKVSFSAATGSISVITGASGSGKSTLLNLMGGLDRCTSGEIVSAGRRLDQLAEADLTEFRSSVLGFVFQFHYLLRDFTAVENVMMPAFMRGISRSNATAQARELLSEVGLADRMEHYPVALSGGERQRAAVARALINNPRLVLADEPTGNLDAENSELVERILVDLVRSHSTTLIMVTHDDSLSHVGDHRYSLAQGKLTSA